MNREAILDLAQEHLMLNNRNCWVGGDDEVVDFAKALLAKRDAPAPPGGIWMKREGDSFTFTGEAIEPGKQYTVTVSPHESAELEAEPVAAGLPAMTKLDEDEQNALLCKIEDYMNMTDKVGTQMHPDCTKAENDIYALVDEFLAKRAAAPLLPVEVPSQPTLTQAALEDQVKVWFPERSYQAPFFARTFFTRDAKSAQPSRPQDDYSLDDHASAVMNESIRRRMHDLKDGMTGWGTMNFASRMDFRQPNAVTVEPSSASGSAASGNTKPESSPIAEPDTATQAPSEAKFYFRQASSFGPLIECEPGAEGAQLFQRATQAAKPLTDEQITEYYDSVIDDFRNRGATRLYQKFARLIESHLKGE